MTIDRRSRPAAAAALLLVGLVACAAPAANPTTSPASVAPTSSTTGAATSIPTAVSTLTTATTAPGDDAPTVDLTFSGDISLVAKGRNGECHLGHGADGSIIGFGFTASESDYKGLGDSFDITEDIASHKVSTKWVVGGTFYAGVFTGGVTVSVDHKSVTFDADIPAGVGRTEHLKGSITCP